MIKINRPQCPNEIVLRSNYKHPDNKTVLVDASCGKCMYCESYVAHIYTGDIEHIKPKSKFPELKFVWDNLGYVCWRCNNNKGDKYDEDNPYVNPYDEEPEKHIIFYGVFLKHKSGSERGKMTIFDIGLNRKELIERRKLKTDQIQKIININSKVSDKSFRKNVIEELKKESSHDKEYSLCIKYFLKINNI